MLSSVVGYQFATRVPFFIRSTEGTSAAVMNQSLPADTVRGSDHDPAARSANRKVVASSWSSQLRTAPFDEEVSCGCALPALAGTSSAASVTPRSNGWLSEGAGDVR